MQKLVHASDMASYAEDDEKLETDAALPKLEKAGSSVEPRSLSFARINCILCFNFANGVLLGSYMLLILPLESQRIDFANRSVILGVLMCISGVTQLVTPLVGLLSDRCMSSLGRRRPFVILGGILGVGGIFAQDFASMNRWAFGYYVAFTVSMFGLTTAYTAVVGIMADLVPSSQTGTATGTAALQAVLGASAGFLIYDKGSAGSDDDRLHIMYMSYISITCVCILLTVMTSREVPCEAIADKGCEETEIDGESGTRVDRESDARSTQWFAPSIQPSDVIASYFIDPRKHFDFTMVFWSRTLYYFSCSVQTFFKFYLKDVVGIQDAEAAIVRIALVGQLCAAVTAIPTGLLSDRVGKMRKPFIYAACFVLALGNIGNCFIRNETDALVVGGFLGAANGVYLAMDAALALDHLPSGDEAARFMGVWGIGCFLGAALGPALGGPILAIGGHDGTSPDAYNYSGYAVLLSLAAVGFVASGAILHKVGARSEADIQALEGARSGAVWVCINKCLFCKRLHLSKVLSVVPSIVSINDALPWVAGSSSLSFPGASPKTAC